MSPILGQEKDRWRAPMPDRPMPDRRSLRLAAGDGIHPNGSDGSVRGGIHIVVLMLENRSFDHMLGFLYEGKTTPSGEPFED